VGWIKLTLYHGDPDYDWSALATALGASLQAEVDWFQNHSVAVFKVHADGEAAVAALSEQAPAVQVMSAGRSIEILKAVGLPAQIAADFHPAGMRGTHMLGHTRMATESAVTMAGSHPFSTGQDLCLVHNGSLSNHNRLRERLRRQGIRFATDNDTEVAAGYLTWRLQQGDSLNEALQHGLKDLDGFYTFAIGTRDGFAVLRDPIACKPAVLAETADYVVMASEYQAFTTLAGIEAARVWEPAPAKVYVWEGHAA